MLTSTKSNIERRPYSAKKYHIPTATALTHACVITKQLGPILAWSNVTLFGIVS